MSDYLKEMQRIREERELNEFTPAKAIDAIEHCRKQFIAANERYQYAAAHVSTTLADYDADIAAVKAGEKISIVQYTWQGAYIA